MTSPRVSDRLEKRSRTALFRDDSNMFKKSLAALGAVCLAGIGVLGAASAASAVDDDTPFVLAAWQMPDDGSGWPQQLALTEERARRSDDLLRAAEVERDRAVAAEDRARRVQGALDESPGRRHRDLG